MVPTKAQEIRLQRSAKLIREALNRMSLIESEDFVLETADGKTLRQLEHLRKVIRNWGFVRS